MGKLNLENLLFLVSICFAVPTEYSYAKGPPKTPEECIAYFIPKMNPGFGSEKDVAENEIAEACTIESRSESIQDCKEDLRTAQKRYHVAASRRKDKCHKFAWFYTTCKGNAACFKQYQFTANEVARFFLEEAKDLEIMSDRLRKASGSMTKAAKINWDTLGKRKSRDMELACKMAGCKDYLVNGTQNEISAMRKPDSSISQGPPAKNGVSNRAKLLESALNLPANFLPAQQLAAALMAAKKNDEMVAGIHERRAQAKALDQNVELARTDENNLSSLSANFGKKAQGAAPGVYLGKEKANEASLVPKENPESVANQKTGTGEGFLVHEIMDAEVSPFKSEISGGSAEKNKSKITEARNSFKGKELNRLLDSGNSTEPTRASVGGNESSSSSIMKKDFSLKQRLLDQLAGGDQKTSEANQLGGPNPSASLSESDPKLEVPQKDNGKPDDKVAKKRGLASSQEFYGLTAGDQYAAEIGESDTQSLFERVSQRYKNCLNSKLIR